MRCNGKVLENRGSTNLIKISNYLLMMNNYFNFFDYLKISGFNFT